MKRVGLKVFVICIVFSIFFGLLPVANAKSVDLQTEISPETVYTGNIFTVTVTFTSNDEAIGTLQASLKYDAGRMEYISGGGNAVELSNGTGGILDYGSETENTISYSLRFRALKTGKANFSVTNSDVTGFKSGANLGNPTLKSTISINKIPDGSNEVKDPLEITLDGKKLYIMPNLSSLDIPQGFEIEELLFNDTKIEAVLQPTSGLVLLYIMDETSVGNFYIYDSATNSFYPYISVMIDVSYIILPPKSVPKGYSLSTAVINGSTVPACVVDLEGKGFILLYAINPSGDKGYYFYDTAEGTMQRVLLSTDTDGSSQASLSSDVVQNVTDSIFIMAAICALLAGLTIWLASSIKNKNIKKVVFKKNKFIR